VHLLDLEELPGREVHHVHVEVVVARLRQQLAQPERLWRGRQKRRVARAAVQEARRGVGLGEDALERDQAGPSGAGDVALPAGREVGPAVGADDDGRGRRLLRFGAAAAALLAAALLDVALLLPVLLVVLGDGDLAFGHEEEAVVCWRRG
jgi:hypothetical protein